MAKIWLVKAEFGAFSQREQKALFEQELGESDLAEHAGVSQLTISD